jgi:hypothetical protein
LKLDSVLATIPTGLVPKVTVFQDSWMRYTLVVFVVHDSKQLEQVNKDIDKVQIQTQCSGHFITVGAIFT